MSVGDPAEQQLVSTSGSPVLAELEETKAKLEIEKLKQDVDAAREGRVWWRRSIRDVKISEWITAAAAIVALIAAFWTGLFNTIRERLSAQADLLEIKKIQLEQKRERLDGEIVTRERELAEIKARLLPLEGEEDAIKELRGMKKKNISVHFEVPPEFDSVYVKIRGTEDEFGGTRLLNKGTVQEPAWDAVYQTFDNPHLTQALKAANKIRSLKRLELSELRLSAEDIGLLTLRPEIETVAVTHAEVDREFLAQLKVQKGLWRLDFSANNISSFDKIGPFESVGALVLRDNPIGDIGTPSMLAAFPKLKILILAGTKITDASMPQIAKLDELWHLDVSRTSVTSDGLAALLNVPSFNGGLRVDGHQITEKLAKQFREKNPHSFSLIIRDPKAGRND